jgi:hypothetical protein
VKPNGDHRGHGRQAVLWLMAIAIIALAVVVVFH